MNHGQHLRDLLEPLGVYRWEGSFQWGELQSEGAALDGVADALASLQQEMNLTTAQGEGLDRVLELLGRERDREDHDERGAMIRAMARARAGDVLLWLLLFGAAYLYFFDVPKWVNITLLGLACVKLLLDWMFTVWYRRQY